MGWFSLVGIDNGPDYCGPMGVGDLLLDPASDDLVNFLQKLARTRSIPTVLDYIVDGHVARPFVISPQAETRQQKVPSGK